MHILYMFCYHFIDLNGIHYTLGVLELSMGIARKSEV